MFTASLLDTFQKGEEFMRFIYNAAMDPLPRGQVSTKTSSKTSFHFPVSV